MLLHDFARRIADVASQLGLPPADRAQADIPPDRALGDVASNYPLTVSKILKRPPLEIAEQIATALRDEPAFESVTVAMPGFVNVRLTTASLNSMVQQLLDAPIHAPLASFHSAERVLCELGSENVAKPMGVGHLRSNVIGMALTRMWKAVGAEVVTVNHLGDWGTQFGKLVVAYQTWGDDARVASRGIQELVELYQRFTAEAKEHPELDDAAREIFRKLEAGDVQIRALWQRFVDLSLAEYRAMYDRLSITHDHIIGESFYEDHLRAIIDELLEKNVATQNADGSIAIEFPKDDHIPSCLVQKSNGSTLYLTRDLAALKYRTERFHPTQTLYFVADQQTLHFKQLFRTAELLGWTTRAEHVSFGMVLGESGKMMATREGTAIQLGELLRRAEAEALRILQERGSDVPEDEWPRVSRDLATAAVIYNDLSQNRSTTIVFDWAQMLSFDGDTAPYLLYTVARTNALEEKARAAGVVPSVISVVEPLERTLATALAMYHDRVLSAAETLRPNLVAEHLHRIAQAFNAWYAELPILNADDAEVRNARLALAFATRTVLRAGMDLLGLPRVDRL